MLGCKPTSSPMEQNVDWWDNASALLEDAGIYRRLVGKLIFLTVTRPDLSYAVSVLSQFMQAPRTIHLEGVYRVLAYIKRAPGKGLLYRRQGHLRIEAYSDSGFVGDKEDRKSHGGYATYVGVNLSHGVLRNSLSSLVLVLKLSIELWLIPQQRCCGCALFLPSWDSRLKSLCRCIVTTWLRPSLLVILRSI